MCIEILGINKYGKKKKQQQQQQQQKPWVHAIKKKKKTYSKKSGFVLDQINKVERKANIQWHSEVFKDMIKTQHKMIQVI